MEKNEIIEYWVRLSKEDYSAMVNLFKSGNYSWSLFIGHLVVEKLLKAYYVKNCDINPPHTHNLTQIAEKAKLGLTEKQKDFFDLLNTFNILARYPDYKLDFYKKCTREYAIKQINEIEELRLWLLKQIEK